MSEGSDQARPLSGPAARGGPGGAWKAAAAIALLAIGGWLVATRWRDAKVAWHLGNVRLDEDTGALARIGEMGRDALPYLGRELESGDPNARVFAVLALAAIPGDESTALLARAARDPDGIAAANAVHALGSRRGGAATEALGRALGDGRFGVRLAARRALAERTGISWWAFGRPRGAGAPAAPATGG